MSDEPVMATTWEQCARHVEAGGVVEVNDHGWAKEYLTAVSYRMMDDGRRPGDGSLPRRLVPIPAPDEPAQVYDSAWVRGSAQVCDSALVCGSAQVGGSALVYDSALVRGSARVEHTRHVVTVGPIGSEDRTVTAYRTSDGHEIIAGCWTGTVDELADRISHPKRAWPDSPKADRKRWRRDYEAVITLVRSRLDEWDEWENQS